jgi:hypothetical protein
MDGFPPGAPPAGEYGKGVEMGARVVVVVGVEVIYGYRKPEMELISAGIVYISFG